MLTKLLLICEKDTRYNMEAYVFVREALDFTSKRLNRPKHGPNHHVSGQELCDGFRELAMQSFGPLAFKVLNTWGVRQTEDIGELVFNLVEAGELGKTDEDKREDFADGFNFHDAFAAPFLPSNTSSESLHKQAPRKQPPR